MKLGYDLYHLDNVEFIAQKLLGKYLVTNFSNVITSGKIVETEAYAGITDKASHAYNAKRTNRTELMYKDGGIAYVYLIYGIYSLFNIVTNIKETPHAVLVRAIEPEDGIETMQKRSALNGKRYFTSGPGLLTQALGISTKHTGISLLENQIWLENRNVNFSKHEIISSPRVGVAYAGEDALLNRRYRIKNNPWVSKAK